MRKLGYLEWSRTRDANLYRINHDKVAGNLGMLNRLKQEHRRNTPSYGDSESLTESLTGIGDSRVTSGVRPESHLKLVGGANVDDVALR